MLILCVKIFKMGAKSLFWSSRPEVFLQIGAPAKLPKSVKNTCEGIYFLVKLEAEGWRSATLLKMIEA